MVVIDRRSPGSILFSSNLCCGTNFRNVSNPTYHIDIRELYFKILSKFQANHKRKVSCVVGRVEKSIFHQFQLDFFLILHGLHNIPLGPLGLRMHYLLLLFQIRKLLSITSLIVMKFSQMLHKLFIFFNITYIFRRLPDLYVICSILDWDWVGQLAIFQKKKYFQV